jgi:hypothetical protein
VNQSSNVLTLQIVYTDTLGVRETAEKTVQILSSQNSTTTGAYVSGFNRGNVGQQSTFSKYKWYIFVIVLVIAGLLFWQYRRRTLMGKNLKLKNIFMSKKK